MVIGVGPVSWRNGPRWARQTLRPSHFRRGAHLPQRRSVTRLALGRGVVRWAAPSKSRATVLRQEFVLLEEFLDQVGKARAGQRAAAEWNAGDIFASDSGEMGNDLTGFVNAENKPWVPLVGDVTVSPNGQPGRPHEVGCAVEMRAFVLRPALPVGSHLGKEHCPASHR